MVQKLSKSQQETYKLIMMYLKTANEALLTDIIKFLGEGEKEKVLEKKEHDKLLKELYSAIGAWKKKYDLDKNKTASVAWHFKDDYKWMKNLNKNLRDFIAKHKAEPGLTATNAERLLFEEDKVRNLEALDMLGRVSEAWETEDSALLNQLVINPNFPIKSHAELYERVKGRLERYGTKK